MAPRKRTTKTAQNSSVISIRILNVLDTIDGKPLGNRHTFQFKTTDSEEWKDADVSFISKDIKTGEEEFMSRDEFNEVVTSEMKKQREDVEND